MSGSSKNETVEKSFKWLSAQNIDTIKELSRTVSAHALWGLSNPYTTRLILQKKDGAWNASVRDTARACSALADAGIILRKSEKWLLGKKTGNSWNEDVYDTAYALRALGEMEIPDRAACGWLYENYGPAWEQVGTTALIITALQRQVELKEEEGAGGNKGKNDGKSGDGAKIEDERKNGDVEETGSLNREKEKKELRAFIKERANWLLSKRGPEGGWTHISTSNLVIQALLLTGFEEEVKASTRWLLDEVRESGAWGNRGDDVNATALSLITLGIGRPRSKTAKEFIPE